jgi:vacuolar-type H+-ATPase subunit H
MGGKQKMSPGTATRLDGMENIIEEFARKISQSVENDRNKLRELAEQESASIITRAQQEADSIIAEAKKKTNSEAEKILAEAKQKAIQAINEADKRIKDEAKQKTKKEKERIIQVAKEEAETLVTRARQMAEEEAKRIVAESRKEADRQRDELIAEAESEAKRKAESDAAQVLAEARDKAQKLITETKNKVHAVLAESGRIVMGAHQALEQTIEAVESGFREAQYQDEVIAVASCLRQGSEESASSKIESRTDKSPAEGKDGRMLEGRLKFQLSQSRDSNRIKHFQEQLLSIPHLKLIASGGSVDEGYWIEAELDEPMPIVKILKGIPFVRETVLHRNTIDVAIGSN